MEWSQNAPRSDRREERKQTELHEILEEPSEIAHSISWENVGFMSSRWDAL